MAPRRPPKDYFTGAAEAQAQPSFLQKYGGGALTTLIVAGIIGLNLNWKSDGIRDEVVSNISSQLVELRRLVDKNTEARLMGNRFTNEDGKALEDVVSKLQSSVSRLEGRHHLSP